MAETNHLYANIRRWEDLPTTLLKELEEFFVNYHRLQGKQYRLLGCRNSARAEDLIKQARRAA